MTGSVASSKERTISRIEAGVAAALAVSAVSVRVVFLMRVCALWRDEVTSVNICATESIRTTLGLLRFDSFPALWALTLRSWIALGLGGSDVSLRVLGVLLGVVAVAAACWAVRRLGGGLPLLVLALLAMSPTAIVWGSEVRGYALGLAAFLATLPAFWALSQGPARPSIVAAAAATALLAVHSSFSSSILLFCVGLAAACVAVRNRAFRTVGLIVAIGAASAASLLVYRPMLASIREWNDIVQNWRGPAWILGRFQEAIGGAAMTAAWALLLAVAIVACVARIAPGARRYADRERDLAIFLVVSAVTGTVGYLAYMLWLKVSTQVWYYLPPMGLLAVFIDVAIEQVARGSARLRLARLGAVVVLVALLGRGLVAASRTRLTDLDLVAEQLRARVGSDDLIVVNPWQAGVTFQRYYRGAAAWVTIPDFAERRYQTYSELKRTMATPEPIRAVLERIAGTLEARHTIWLVGGLPFLKDGQRLETLPPAPNSPRGWSESAYEHNWLQQAAYTIQTRARGLSPVPVGDERPVNQFENARIYVVNAAP